VYALTKRLGFDQIVVGMSSVEVDGDLPRDRPAMIYA
jgi:hypothetical protein